MTPSEKVRKAIRLLEIRTPIGIRKAGCVRDLYRLLVKGIEPPRWTYARTRWPRPASVRKIPPPPVIVSSDYIKRRFGIKV